MATSPFTPNPAATTIPGGGVDDILLGTEGDDVFPGGAGRQFMAGGAGNDLYFVDSQDDVVFEAAGGGEDSISAGASFQLYEGVEALGLEDRAGDAYGVGNGLDNTIFGNIGNNLLIGLDGNDILDGDEGNDTLFGGAGDDSLFGWVGENTLVGGDGNDQYWVTYNSTATVEEAGGGEDLVHVSPEAGAENAYYLQANVEGLLLEGSSDSWGVGNALGNTIDGNAGANVILGGGGDDTIGGGDGNDMLFGEDGNDELQAGTGADVLIGGDGDDVYAVDGMEDLIFEAAGGGSQDLVIATVGDGPGNAYYLYAWLENLQLAGTADSWGVGNELANFMTGNDGNNWLLGGDGNDTLVGGAGNDVLFGGAGADLFVFAPGNGADAVVDFAAGTDDILLTGFAFADFAAVQAAMVEIDGSTGIDLGGGDLLVLNGVTMASLTAGDFAFA